MKKIVFLFLFLILFFLQINVYAVDPSDCDPLFKDIILKKDQEGNLLSGAGFTIRDAGNNYSIPYSEKEAGRFEIKLYRNPECYSIQGTSSFGKRPTVRKLAQTISPDSAVSLFEEIGSRSLERIYYLEDWNNNLPGVNENGYREEEIGSYTYRYVDVVFPLIIDETKTPIGYIKGGKYVVLLHGIAEMNYRTRDVQNGYSYISAYDRKFYFKDEDENKDLTYYRYDPDYKYSKMMYLNHDKLVAFQEQYAIDDIYSYECTDSDNHTTISNDIQYGETIPPECSIIHNITNHKGDVTLEISNRINDGESTSATKGETIQYNTLIKNTGTVDSYNVQVKTVVPTELEYIQNSANFGGEYDEETRTVTWEISKLDAGSEADLKYKATVSSDVADFGTIQLRSTVTSDEYPEEIDSGEVTIEVQKKSEAFIDNATQVITNPKTGSILSMIICILSIVTLFILNYHYQKKKEKATQN